MNLRLSLLNIFLPRSMKEETMRELFAATASAFQMPVPDLDGLRFDEVLQTYGIFTRAAVMAQMEKDGDLDQVRNRLYDGAFRIGKKVRDKLRIHSRDEAIKAAKLLYRAIGIDFLCSSSGEVLIRSCYFSNFYSCEVCWIISSLDDGLIAGLTGGGRLWFVSRITEGEKLCLGQIDF